MDRWTYPEAVLSAALSFEHRFLALGGWHRIDLWDFRKTPVSLILEDSCVDGPFGTLAFSHSGSIIASGYGNEYVRVPSNPPAWPVHFEKIESVHLWYQNGPRLTRLSVQQPGVVTAVSFSPDGRHLAVGNDVGGILLYRIG